MPRISNEVIASATSYYDFIIDERISNSFEEYVQLLCPDKEYRFNTVVRAQFDLDCYSFDYFNTCILFDLYDYVEVHLKTPKKPGERRIADIVTSSRMVDLLRSYDIAVTNHEIIFGYFMTEDPEVLSRLEPNNSVFGYSIRYSENNIRLYESQKEILKGHISLECIQFVSNTINYPILLNPYLPKDYETTLICFREKYPTHGNKFYKKMTKKISVAKRTLFDLALMLAPSIWKFAEDLKRGDQFHYLSGPHQKIIINSWTKKFSSGHSYDDLVFRFI